MDSSRQLLLGTGVFLGGGILLFALVQKMDDPQDTAVNNTPKVEEVSTSNSNTSSPLTADVNTEGRILEQKRLERESRVEELNKRTLEFLSEQERAEALAMEKARLENERYRNNAAEPVIDESPEYLTDNPISVPVTQPVVQARQVQSEQNFTQQQNIHTNSNTSNNNSQFNTSNRTQTATNQNPNTQATTTPAPSATAKTESIPETKTQTKNTTSSLTNSTQKYQVKRGDGLIKLAREYDVPVEAISQANKLSKNSTLRLGQEITIPARSQVNRLVRDYNAKNGTTSTNTQATNSQANNKPNPTPSSSAPTRQLDYKVERGDGLIKLARQYNVPVEALAEANNMSTQTSLRVGQKLVIPSRNQVARLQREAEQKKAAEQNKREAQQRLAEARRKAASGEAKGTFGVQVALANDQQKANEIVKKLRSAGYPATTSTTSRGVRVIVGPEKGKEAALALKDKINADSRTGVNNAWVLYWR